MRSPSIALTNHVPSIFPHFFPSSFTSTNQIRSDQLHAIPSHPISPCLISNQSSTPSSLNLLLNLRLPGERIIRTLLITQSNEFLNRFLKRNGLASVLCRSIV